MNVANALAAAAAAWAAGAHLHDIRQGLRTFSTSFFQAPGRLNLLDVGGVRVVIDYCHNVDGMRQLADFVEPDDGRAADQGRAGRRAGHGGRGPAGRSACSASRATGATTTSASTGRSPPARSTRSSSARTRTCAAGRRARPPRNVDRGRRARHRRPARPRATRVGEGPRRDDARSGRRCAGRSRRPRGVLRRRCHRASIARRWPPPARPVAGRRSPTRASSRPRRADGRPPMSRAPPVAGGPCRP